VNDTMTVLKRTFVVLLMLGIAAGLGALAVALQPAASVDWQPFEPGFRHAIHEAGFTISENRSTNADAISLPINLILRPPPAPRTSFVIGFPNSAFLNVVQRDGVTGIGCYARYLNGRAVVIEIHASPQQRPQAIELRAAFTKEFPGLPIRLKIQ
jgi:hypothetical protein